MYVRECIYVTLRETENECVCAYMCARNCLHVHMCVSTRATYPRF